MVMPQIWNEGITNLDDSFQKTFCSILSGVLYIRTHLVGYSKSYCKEFFSFRAQALINRIIFSATKVSRKGVVFFSLKSLPFSPVFLNIKYFLTSFLYPSPPPQNVKSSISLRIPQWKLLALGACHGHNRSHIPYN